MRILGLTYIWRQQGSFYEAVDIYKDTAKHANLFNKQCRPPALTYVTVAPLLNPIKAFRLCLGLGCQVCQRVIIDKVVEGPNDHVGHGISIGILIDLNPHIGLAVLLLPLLEQILEFLQRILGLQKWTVGVTLNALNNNLRVDVEPNNNTGLELGPVLDSRDDSSAGTDDASDVGMDGVQNLRLDITESILSLGLEYVGDGHFGRLLNDGVRVQEVVGSHSFREFFIRYERV